jgi:hypothetical protein
MSKQSKKHCSVFLPLKMYLTIIQFYDVIMFWYLTLGFIWAYFFRTSCALSWRQTVWAFSRQRYQVFCYFEAHKCLCAKGENRNISNTHTHALLSLCLPPSHIFAQYLQYNLNRVRKKY